MTKRCKGRRFKATSFGLYSDGEVLKKEGEWYLLRDDDGTEWWGIERVDFNFVEDEEESESDEEH